MHRPPWRTAGSALLHALAVWGVATCTLVLLAATLPDFRLEARRGDGLTDTGLAAALVAAFFGLLHTLVWPLLVRLMLLVPALVPGALVFLCNGLLLWVALTAASGHRQQVDPHTAVIVAAAVSAASSATSTLLAVRDDGAYRRRLARLAGRRRRNTAGAAPPATPGTVILQLDGIGHAVLRDALSDAPDGPGRGRPLMPTVAALCRDTHRLLPWHTDWASQTGASQLGLLHGSNEDVPAFRWYEKETGEVMVCNRPSGAATLQRRAAARAGHPGLLAGDGASRGNLFAGGARQLALVLSVAARRGPGHRSRAGYFAYFSDPANATRTAVSYLAEVVREILQAVRARLRGGGPRVSRGGLYPFIRAFATVVHRDVVVAAVLGDMLAGRTVVYADLVAYDEVAHHSGPRSPDTHQVLRRLDRCVALIAKVAEHAPRPYRLVLLSDHGQSFGPTFADAYGLTLEDLVRAGCGLPVSRRAERSASGAEARAAARAALHRPEDGPRQGRRVPRGRDPVVLGSGNLGLVSFPDVPGRMTREQIERRHPALLRALADHPGIGFLLVHSERHGPVVLGARGAEHRLATGEVRGADPLAPFGPHAARLVRRTAGFPHAADIMVNSAVDPRTGWVHAFEDQIGSHGGLGGEQNTAFLLAPRDLPLPREAADDGDEPELVGAERLHRVLRHWLAVSAASRPVPHRRPARPSPSLPAPATRARP